MLDSDGEIIEDGLNSTFVCLSCFVRDLSTPGNGEGASEQISEEALTKIHPEPHSSAEEECISMLRFQHRGKAVELLIRRK